MQRNSAVIATQLTHLRAVIGRLVSRNTRYALLDFPDHPNVGDSAIWLGELKLLLELTGHAPAYVCTIASFDADKLRQAVPSGAILIHGGGNFGDIWRKHQDFRELILKQFKDRLVVQLPQSIKFSDESAIQRCAKLIAEHANFHFLVRDQQSLTFATTRFACPTELTPDAAFALESIARPIPPRHPVFALLRTDVERASYDRAPFEAADTVSADWLEDVDGFRRIAKFKAALQALFTGAWGYEQLRPIFYKQLATARLNRGLRMLSTGHRVITDRLHAHILSTLMDIPHVAMDNNYGKISGYIGAWTNSYPGVQVATTAQEALQKLEGLPS